MVSPLTGARIFFFMYAPGACKRLEPADVVGGRPKTLNKGKRVLSVRLYHEKEHTIKQICHMMNISKPTLYSYINEKE
jgi:hypothetical protein